MYIYEYLIAIVLFVSELRFIFALSLWITAASSMYKIGVGIADVTGPAAGVTFVSIILILI